MTYQPGKSKMILACGVIVLLVHYGSCQNTQQNENHAKYIIIGGGLAGLSAAKNLAINNETDFIILEGANRIGGRVKHGQIGGHTVQLGSQWLQGASGDVVFELADKVQLQVQASDYDDVVVYDETGTEVTDTLDDRWEDFSEALGNFYELSNRLEVEDTQLPDLSQRDALSFYQWRPETGVDYAIEYFDMDFTYGQPPETASTRFGYIPTSGEYLEEIVYDQNAGGLSKIVGALVSEIPGFSVTDPRLHLEAVVESVKYDDNGVEVTTTNGTVYTGSFVIITCSLGVLKNEKLRFTPELPEWKRYNIQGSTYITDYPIYLHFPINFWGSSEFILYGTEHRGLFSLWQNFDKFLPDSNILQLQMSGPEAKRLARNTDAEIQQEIMVALKKMFGDSIPDPDEILVPDWYTNPLFLGTYSDWSPAYPGSSFDALRAPVGRVYFAGEGYSRDYFGYMQGAILSGKDETDKLMACDADSTRCERYQMPSPTSCPPPSPAASWRIEGTMYGTIMSIMYAMLLK